MPKKQMVKEAVHPHGEHICVCPKDDAEVTVAANVKCSTQLCPECGMQMRAQDIGEGKTKEATNMPDMSDDNKRQMLQTALSNSYIAPQPDPVPHDIWIEDVFETEIIYRVNDELYKASYTLDEGGTATFGNPEKVVRRTVYETVESLRSAYQEFIQEAGKRNASRDAKLIKEIKVLVEKLLSSEEPDEDKVNEAITRVNDAMVEVKKESITRTEEGAAYPASAFAYTPETDKPGGWKLRMWEDIDQKATKRQLGTLAAALSPGGLKGQKAVIPAEALSGVKRRIRAAYRALEISEDDIPKWVKEATTRESIRNVESLSEAKVDKGRAHVVVIKAGFNVSKERYYPADMLARDYKIFEGAKMFADHPSESEEHDRPERSIRDWVATLKDVTCDESGTVTGVAEIISPWLMETLSSLRDKTMLSEMGISIDAVGNASKTKVDGVPTLVVETLVRARSVDFVTSPGAGGIVTLYEADRSQDVDLVELAGLRERRPDLIAAIESDVRAEVHKEVKHIMEIEEQVKEKDAEIAALTTERDGLLTQAQEAVKQAKIAETKATVEAAIGETDLPEAAKKRLVSHYAEADSADGLEDAIKAEKSYIDEIRQSGKPKGVGESNVVTEDGRAKLREAFKDANPEWSDATLDAAVSKR